MCRHCVGVCTHPTAQVHSSMLLGRCCYGQALEVNTEAQSEELLSPSHITRWASYPSLWGSRAHTLAQEGRKRPAGGGWVEIGRAALGQGARLPSVPLPPLPTWSPELRAGMAFARQWFHHSLPGPGEPLGAQQSCPGQTTGEEAHSRVTETQVQILPLPLTRCDLSQGNPPLCPFRFFL